MAFLRINGTVVLVADGSFAARHKDVAQQLDRGAGTRALPDRIALRRTYEFKTVPMTPSAAVSLKGTIHGAGAPILSVDGDAIGAVLTCFGTVSRMENMPARIGGTFYPDAKVLSVTLDER